MSVPNLPPRSMASPMTYKPLLQCTTLSPMALLARLESTSDHQHVFKSFVIGLQDDQEEKLIETVDIEDLNTTPISETTTLSQYICQICHAWLHVTHTLLETQECPGKDYLCHHYHVQGLDTYECCGCEYTLATEIHDSVLPMIVLDRLSATRPKARSFADLMQQKEQTPTMASTLTTVLVYIKDLLNGLSRNINTNNPHFLARIGLSDGR